MKNLKKLIEKTISNKDLMEDVNTVDELWDVLLTMFGNTDGDMDNGEHITRDMAEELFNELS